jgi:formylglycine-generating enzyme required for sulfatase activity/serine/threonine protein kinase
MAPFCPTRDELDSFQAGDLEETALAAVSLHVESCPNCQRSLETIIGDSADTILNALLAEPEPSPFAAEAACRLAIERVAAIAGAASPAAQESAPTATVEFAPNSPDDVLPLETIREYKLLAKLGEGGMGAVYKALHTRLDKVVALKVLPQGRMRDSGSVARFQREMKAVGRLDHPNIVRAMDAGEEDGTHFLVMEYVEGADLSQLAKNVGSLPVADACELVRQAAIGLQEAHEHGMVHRDIKPSNLILARSPRKKSPPTLKILDLGLALLAEALSPDQGLTSTGQMIGTIDYMAPEQGSDTHRVDIRADIYSLGATLYRLLTGAAPFASEKFGTPVKKILALATKEPAAVKTLRADIPPTLAAVIHKLLAKDPAERYATPEELAEALTPFCQGANLTALLERGTQSGQPNTSETPTHPHLSSGSADTAPTIDRSIKLVTKPKLPSQAGLAGLGRKIPRSAAIAAACGGAALVILLGVVFYLETIKGTIRIEINDDKIKVVLDEKGATFEGAHKHSVRVQPGAHGLTITCGDLKFDTDKFELTKGETVRLSVTYSAGQVEVIDTRSKKSLGRGVVPQLAGSGWQGWPKDAPKPAIAPFDAKQARQHQKEWADYLGVPVEHENSLGMKFVLIPPGEFLMGSTAKEIGEALKLVSDKQWQDCINSEGPQHRIILTKPIYLGVHEVKQAEYEKVMGKNPSFFAKTGPLKPWVEKVAGLDTTGHPAEGVSWNDAAEFCATLSELEKLKPCYSRSGETITVLDGTGYCLPTEAQWEFGCRAGTTTKYWSGDKDEDLAKSGWFLANSGSRTHRAGELQANPFGLYDVHGNAWEWVQDGWNRTYYRQFQKTPALDPGGPLPAGSHRVIRGGDCSTEAYPCRTADRFAMDPLNRSNFIGFRAVLSVQAVKAAVAERATIPATASTGWHGWPANAPKPAIAPFDATQARTHQKEWADYLGVPVEHENSVGMKFVFIPPGEFLMGSTPAEIDTALKEFLPDNQFWNTWVKSEGPRHKVVLTQPFYLGTHEVTQKQYESIIGTNPSWFAKSGPTNDILKKSPDFDTPNYPVENVSWNDAAEYCAKLSQREQMQPCYERSGEKVSLLAGNGYRLPTEAQWEFACRAGTTTRFSCGDDTDQLLRAGWFDANSEGGSHPVGTLSPNALGLYDMHGNVMEWCQDAFEESYFDQFAAKVAIDPAGSLSPASSGRMIRGGAWPRPATVLRAPHRFAQGPDYRHGVFGIRLVLPVDAVKATIANAGWHGWPKDAPKPAIAPFTAEQARKHQEEWAKYLGVPVKFENTIDMKFVLIPPGEFLMGTTKEEMKVRSKDVLGNAFFEELITSQSPQHVAVLTQPVYLGIHEVTQQQFQTSMKTNPSLSSTSGSEKEKPEGQDAGQHPVDSVTWNKAVDFCIAGSRQEKLKLSYAPNGDLLMDLKDAGYRLPTEAEWEFACRAGTMTKYWSGDKDEHLMRAGWTTNNSGGHTHKVGELLPNPFGLFDTHGNVWEWCQDGWDVGYYRQFEKTPAVDPRGTASSTQRVGRGGFHGNPAMWCNSAHRYAVKPEEAPLQAGFRVTVSVGAVKALLERKPELRDAN